MSDERDRLLNVILDLWVGPDRGGDRGSTSVHMTAVRIAEAMETELSSLRSRLEAAEAGIAHHRWCRSCAEDGCAQCPECREHWPEGAP